MILAFFFIDTFYHTTLTQGVYDFANEFDILPQSSSPNNNNKGGGGGSGGGADVSSPLKGMVVGGNRSSQAHQYHRRGGGESGFSPPTSSMIDHDEEALTAPASPWLAPTMCSSHAASMLLARKC